jgi:hypothetical protein
MTKRIKCCRTCCKRTTKDPKADHWFCFEEPPQKLPHWKGQYMCQPFGKDFVAMLIANGAERITEH